MRIFPVRRQRSAVRTDHDHPADAVAAPDQPTPGEALEIFNAYTAYFGTYEADEGNIHHHVEGAWDPTQVGSVQTTPYVLDGDTLTIGDQVTYRRTLKRVS